MGELTPADLTAEQIREHLAAGEEVWLWEGGRPKHKVFSVEGLTADHVTLGEDFKIFFKGAITGRMLGKHMNRDATIKAVTRTLPTPKEPSVQTADAEDSRG
ncbi:MULTISPECIES: hypothetical protein [unclassified Nonomuraea]|uniref:hypothetical protein n=1 Tax=unclassified Nonomuraea TaxID=2593643 RepID=UPI0033E27A90